MLYPGETPRGQACGQPPGALGGLGGVFGGGPKTRTLIEPARRRQGAPLNLLQFTIIKPAKLAEDIRPADAHVVERLASGAADTQ